MAIAPDLSSVSVCTKMSVPDVWDPLILPIDKSIGLTSFDIIRRLRRISPTRKIGHAGTLDPMATGLLICLAGRATKLMTTFMEQRKTYTGTIRLGETTPSYDAETEVDERTDASAITDGDVEGLIPTFSGDITQTTPSYSAVKVRGERLYKKARRGERVKLPTRDVSVYRFEVTARNGTDINFEIECSKGTYIRSIAHEFGAALGVGGHLVALRRTQIGSISVADAWKVEELISAVGETS